MIEILIAMAICAIILLAMLTWQVYEFKTSQGSYYRNIASLLASDIVNRMQLNTTETSKGKASLYVENTTAHKDYDNITCHNNIQGCKPHMIAASDLHSWQQAVIESLPNSAGKICFDNPVNQQSYECNGIATNDGQRIIKIRWQDSSGTTKIHTTQAILPFHPWQHLCQKPSQTSQLAYQQAIYEALIGSNAHDTNFFSDLRINNLTTVFAKLTNSNNLTREIADHLCYASCNAFFEQTSMTQMCECKKQAKYMPAINFNCNYATNQS